VDEYTQLALASAIAEVAHKHGHSVAAAESITAGNIAFALATGANASEWFTGSIVAYRTALKRQLLGVTAQHVITAECAIQMMKGVLAVTRADVGVATTGAGGPDEEEGQPPGTVFICVGTAVEHAVFEHHFTGEPAAVVSLATTAALRHLRLALLRVPSHSARTRADESEISKP
jgi:nicotinamide-nucleotide amidase